MFIFDEKSNVNSKYQSDSIQFFHKSFYGTFVNTFVRNKKNLTFSICIYVLIIEHFINLTDQVFKSREAQGICQKVRRFYQILTKVISR